MRRLWLGASLTHGLQQKQGIVPCRVYDNFLTPAQLGILQDIFESPQASYWTDHGYSVEPPSPYFSYLIPLSDHGTNNDPEFLNSLVHQLQNRIAATWKPAIRQATTCELWAHNRPMKAVVVSSNTPWSHVSSTCPRVTMVLRIQRVKPVLTLLLLPSWVARRSLLIRD